MERNKSEKLDEILGQQFKVLDDGFVRVVDYMGNDQSIVQAARVSYGEGTKKVSDDESLIRYLVRNKHTTPLEMCEIKFHVRVPMDCWRQWIRHRSASVNEYSTRYSLAIDSAQTTKADEWRLQSDDNKQGSSGVIRDNIIADSLCKQEQELQKHARDVYENRLKVGVAREQARKDLPLSTYTEAYWKIDLHNLMHFLRLRMDGHAQHEIRQYANAIGNIVDLWVPMAWAAFNDYHRNSIQLSVREVKVLNAINSGSGYIGLCEEFKWFKNGKPARSRERSEFEAKLLNLGITIPW